MSKDQTEASTVTSTVAHLMVFFVISLLGFLFLAVNARLLVDALGAQRYDTLGELAVRGIARCKSAFALVGSSHFTLLIGVGLLSLIFGYMVQQVSGTFAVVFAFLAERLPKRFRFSLFSPLRVTATEHGSFKIFLHENRTCKLEWEWEYFNYCFYWGLFTNVITFVLLSFFLVKDEGLFFSIAGPFYSLFLLIQCLGRSRTMLIVHEGCLARKKPKPQDKEISAAQTAQ